MNAAFRLRSRGTRRSSGTVESSIATRPNLESDHAEEDPDCGGHGQRILEWVAGLRVCFATDRAIYMALEWC